jgi:hypothetical protein
MILMTPEVLRRTLSRYTELNADQKFLTQQLKLNLPPQPPPRITAPHRPPYRQTHPM